MTRNSALHRAVGDLLSAGSLKQIPIEQLRAVLSGAGLGLLLPALQTARINSLESLKRLTVQQLQYKLSTAGARALSVGQQRQLGRDDLCRVQETRQENEAVPRAPQRQRMERD